MSRVFSKLTMAMLLAVSCFLVTGCGEGAAPPADPPAATEPAGSESADMEKGDMEKADMGSEAKEEAAGSEAKTEGSDSH